MREVLQKYFQAEQRFDLWIQIKLDQLSDVSNDFDLRLDVDLIFLPDVILEVVPEHGAELVGDLWQRGEQDGDEPRVEGQQVEPGSVHPEQAADKLLPVVFAVERDQEVDGRVVDQLPVDAVRQVVQEGVQDYFIVDRRRGRIVDVIFYRNIFRFA